MTGDVLRDRAERQLVRKLDSILLPILTITFGLQYYDKAVLGSAAVFGIIEDLGLSQNIDGAVVTTRYSTVTAAFYWGYIVAVLPMAVLFARTPLPQTTAAIVFIWGIICTLTVVVPNYEGLIAQRFFLGLMESAVGPAFIAVTCLWYKPEEQATRLGIWYSATGLFSMVSGAINYALGSAGGPLRPWKYMYLFAGGFTIVWAFILLFFLPISPVEPGRFFNTEQREILGRRFRENPWGKDRMSLRSDQAKEAVLDVKTWLYMLMAAAIYICNGAVTAFGARIVSSFGYTPLQTIAVLIPGGATTCLAIYIFSFLADNYRNLTTLLLPISCLPVVIGSLMIWLAPWTPRGIPLVGYYLLPTFGAPYVLLLSLGSANVLGSTKKAITSGAIFIGYNVGNIVAAYLVFTQESTIKYRSTWIAVIVSMAATTTGSLALRFLYARENRRRDAAPCFIPLRVAAEGEESPFGSKSPVPDSSPDAFEYVDLTDRQRVEFRYSL